LVAGKVALEGSMGNRMDARSLLLIFWALAVKVTCR